MLFCLFFEQFSKMMCIEEFSKMMRLFYLQLDIKLNFENQSYSVDTKDDPEIPVILITYPTVYVAARMFPFSIKVETKDDTATGKSLHTILLNVLLHSSIYIVILLFLSTIEHNSRIIIEHSEYEQNCAY